MSSNRIRSATESEKLNAFVERAISIKSSSSNGKSIGSTERKQSIKISTLSATSHRLLKSAIQERKSLKYSIFRTPRSRQEKFLSFVLCFLLVCVCVFLLSLWIMCDRWKGALSKLTHIYVEDDDICDTEACQETAKQLISNIDPETDPCTDFYQHACGGWMKNNPIPSGYSEVMVVSKRQKEIQKQILDLLKTSAKNHTSKSVRNAAKLFEGCMNTESRDERALWDLFYLIKDHHGGWPMLGQWTEKDYVWYKQAAKANRELLLDLFVEFEFLPYAYDNSKYILLIDSGYFIFDHEDDENATNANYTAAAQELIVNAARLMGSEMSITDLQEEAMEILEFEKMLYLASLDTIRENISMPISNIQINVTTEDFLYTEFINLHLRSEAPVEEDTIIYALAPNYLRMLPDMIAETNPRTVANYVAFYIYGYFDSITSEAAINLTKQFEVALGMKSNPRNLEKACVASTRKYMPLAVGRVYVDNLYPQLHKSHVIKMLNMIRLAYTSTIDQNDWMDEKTLRFSLYKLKSIQSMVFYEDWILNDTVLDQYYSKVGDIEVDDFFKSMVRLRKALSDRIFSRWNQTIERGAPDSATNNPTVMNAFYAPYSNFIALPSGIFGYPYYKYGRIDSINYGGIGTVIGHEISHAFDTSGRKYDHIGNKRNWWTNETLYKYAEKAQCFIDQYNNFTDPLSPVKANGRVTLKENIADNGGVKSAFKAFRLHLALSGEYFSYRKRLPELPASPEQLFFLGYASIWCTNMSDELAKRYNEFDSHSPSKIRVNVPLSNFKEFAKAFKCKAGSPMNPIHKCNLW